MVKLTAAAAALMAAVIGVAMPSTFADTIVVGGDETSDFPVGWVDGVCYLPIRDTQVGDELQFNINGGHNVYKMASEAHYEDCDFSDGLLLQQAGQVTSYAYTISEQDKLDGTVYFACEMGAHCMGQQKLAVSVFPLPTDSAIRDSVPTSAVVIGLSSENCAATQKASESEGGDFGPSTAAGDGQQLQSECTSPELQDDNKTYFVSCLSPPATMTPGGVINNLFLLHYPYPTDRRVALGLRMWEFVSGDPVDSMGAATPLELVPINQLYIHHLSGRVVLGQGTEGVRRSEPDAPFPEPYAAVTGNEGDVMIFHLIDLREVDEWLPCLECRCRDPADGTYLNGGTAGETGGVNCCTNCTALEGPTIDYRMRYNVSYYDIEEDSPIREVQMITADISPAVNKNLEYDVPSKEFLPVAQQKTGHPWVQRLERTMPFNELMQMEFFGDSYKGHHGATEQVKLLRCVAHLHISSMGMWLIDAVTNETLCEGLTSYGDNPGQDKGFLKAVQVDTYDTPKVFPATRPVTLIADYNATEVHTGVMGMYFLFVEGSHGDLHASETPFEVDLCQPETCDMALLPFPSMEDDEDEDEPVVEAVPKQGEGIALCEDTLADSPVCKFGGVCDCAILTTAPETTDGGCGGIYVTPMGNTTVNDVCASYCGCPADAPIAGVITAACQDTLADSPVCTFGGVCDCAILTTAPETTDGGCGGVYVTSMGNTTVNDVCANFCGCPADDTLPAALTCEDTLAESPVCKFGNVCDCETLATAPETTAGGCGGVYVTPMGNTSVNDVCANYCGCPDAAVIDAVPVTPGASAELTCEDTLAENPACKFGNICDCETLVNAPETDGGCGGVYATPMGNITVNDVCANYCGCPAPPAPTGPSGLSNCPDALAEHPACRFGGLCDCETLVNAPESTGCGGVYSTPDMGDMNVNSVCQSYCKDCPPMDVQRQKDLVEFMEDELNRQCKYATSQCRATLSNLYACSATNAANIADPLRKEIVTNEGQMLALKHAKLGAASIHRGKDEQVVEMCSPEVESEEAVAVNDVNSAAASSSYNFSAVVSLVVAAVHMMAMAW